jgi:hypothetical protein
MPYTEKELSKLIEDVEKEFTVYLKKAEEADASPLVKSEGAESPKVEPLAKAEDEKKEAKAEDKKDEPKEEKKDEAPKADEKAAESKEAAPEAKPEDKKDEAPSEPKAEAKEGEEHCDYDDEDLEHMSKMYMSMSKAELKAHHDSVRQALDGHGLAKCGDMTMSKSEQNTSIEVAPEVVKVEEQKPNSEMALLKSEVEAQKAKADGLQERLEAVSKFLTKLVEKTAPQGKAVTSYDAITKSEGSQEAPTEISKGEITAKLLKKSAEPSLKKSDRDAINAYYLDGTSINTISHLLK